MKNAAALLCLLSVSAAAAEDMEAMMRRCAPAVHPKTLSAIVRAESNARAYVISDDGPIGLPWSQRKSMIRSFDPATKDDAAKLVEDLTTQNHMVGIGLTQINSRHLKRMKTSVQDALDPCINLQLGAQILVEFYVDAMKRFADSDRALLAAISAYNTGSFENGFGNGYVQKVVNASQHIVPEIRYGRVGKTNVAQGRATARSSREVTATVNSRHNALLEAKLAGVEVESF
jgi:type IV secretion system protein VirB1